MEKNKEKFLMSVILILGSLLLIPISSLVNGFVLMKLWHWIVVPIFGIDKIFLAESIGIMLVSNTLFKNDVDNSDKEPKKIISKIITKLTVKPLFLLTFGWVVSLFLK